METKLEISKKLDWHNLVFDLMNGLFMNQQTLAERCKVSQQSISNWKNRTRNPGITAKQQILKLAQKEKIDLSKYETNEDKDRLLELFSKMTVKNKVKFLQYGSRLVK